MVEWFDALGSWGAPWLEIDKRDAKQTADTVRSRLLLSLCLGTVVAALLMAGIFWLGIDAPLLAALNLTGSLVMAGTWPVMRWSRSVTLATNWASFALVFTLASLVPFTGGIDSPGIDWLVLAPIFALVFGSRKSGLVWGGITVVIVITVYFIPDSALVLPNYTVNANHDLLKVLSTILLLGLLSGLFVIVRRYHRELLDVAVEFQSNASVDPLTNLPNRREFEHQLSLQIQHARRERSLLAVAELDVDRFKSINDTYGHAAGDTVLTEVANRLDDTCRDNDVVARFGGDEFTVLLKGVDRAADLDAVGQRIRECFTEPFEAADKSLEIDCSIGFGLVSDDSLRWLDDEEARERILEIADAAMYESKTSDRDWAVERLE